MMGDKGCEMEREWGLKKIRVSNREREREKKRGDWRTEWETGHKHV